MAEKVVTGVSGAIMYNAVGSYDKALGELGGYKGVGSLSGGGKVWSDSEQVIWVSINDAPKYPVIIKPGWNDVYFWIPMLFPKDEWVDAFIEIEAPGYILIPAGFEFNLKMDGKVEPKPQNPSMIEKLKFKDLYDIEIVSVPVPVNLDDIVDDIEFEDVYMVDTINTNIHDNNDYIQSIKFSDLYDILIEEEEIPIDLDGIIGTLGIEDLYELESLSTNIVYKDNISELEMGDLYSIDIEEEEIPIDLDDIVDLVEIGDVVDMDNIMIDVRHKDTNDTWGIEDVINIEVEEAGGDE